MKKMDPVVHFEMPAKDQKRMVEFYEKAFGWETTQLGNEVGGYVLVTTSETDKKVGFPKKVGMINGGFYSQTDDAPSPSVVIAVENIKEAMERITKAGGKVLGEPVEIPGIGHYVSFLDTEGNRSSLMQPHPMPESIPSVSNLTTCLWFDKEAEEAANFYVKVFSEGGRSASIGKIARYSDSGSEVSGQPKGTVMSVEFELDGNKFLGLNGGPVFKFSPATSFVVNCKTQEEVDYFWEKLGEGGKKSQCGWIDADKFGVSWQIVPEVLGELMSSGDAVQSERVMKAMLSMKKLDIQGLKDAYEGK